MILGITPRVHLQTLRARPQARSIRFAAAIGATMPTSAGRLFEIAPHRGSGTTVLASVSSVAPEFGPG